jgi:serine/threonine protein kinase
LAEEWRGRTLSKVRIDSLIARGGMAAVFLGEHITLQRPMAVKILHDHLADDPDLLARFKAEAQSVAALRHPNIVQVTDFDVFEGRPYFAMEYVRGVTLAKYLTDLHLRKKRLRAETITRLMTPLASALDYAHARGIIHRDVKPANIILRQGNQQILPGRPIPLDVEPVLTDFGVARIRDATTHTATGTILGTPAYMSPEQVAGKLIDSRSDIYSLGIILYEMLAGRPPFVSEHDTPVSILMKHLDEPHPPLPPVHSSLQFVVDNALAKDPNDRYSTAGELAHDLVRITSPGGIVTPPLEQATSGSDADRDELPMTDRETVIDQKPQSSSRSPRSLLYGTLAAVGLISIVGILFLAGIPQSLLNRNPETPTESSAPTDIVAEALPTQVSVSDTQTPATPDLIADSFDLSGETIFLDDHIQAQIEGLVPLDAGQTYSVWLAGRDEVGTETFRMIATGNPDESRLTIEFDDEDGQNLIAHYHAFLISIEPNLEEANKPSRLVYRYDIPAEITVRAALIDNVQIGNPISENLLDWMLRQAQHYASHINNALNSIESNDLAGATGHSEHVINIIEGELGEFYQDWNNNGSIENPGDRVGLLEYLRFLEDFATNMPEEESDFGATLSNEAEGLIAGILNVRETARQIALADGLDLILDLGLDQDFRDGLPLRDQVGTLAEQAIDLDFAFTFSIFTTSN